VLLICDGKNLRRSFWKDGHHSELKEKLSVAHLGFLSGRSYVKMGENIKCWSNVLI
jgi:hypothetical protein